MQGDRLPIPITLNGSLSSVYFIMNECWCPVPEMRKTPQTILRDLNQLLYRVFNAKKIHTYITVDDSGRSSPSGSMQTLQTTAGSDDTVIYLSSSTNSEVHPPDIPSQRPRIGSLESTEEETLQKFGEYAPPSSSKNSGLVPVFRQMMQKHLALLQGTISILSHSGIEDSLVFNFELLQQSCIQVFFFTF